MDILRFEPETYGKIFAQLIDPNLLNNLGPGQADETRRKEIESINLRTVFQSETKSNNDNAKACSSAIWLHHDFLDESHSISQDIPTISGSFWHGIMHRREGDYWNSKYWFRQVGNHPVFSNLYTGVTQLLNSSDVAETKMLLQKSSWDPFLFVDMVQKYIGSDTEIELLLKKVQQLEWQLLFDYCYRMTTGSVMP